jgi:hypothetical protein
VRRGRHSRQIAGTARRLCQGEGGGGTGEVVVAGVADGSRARETMVSEERPGLPAGRWADGAREADNKRVVNR